MQVGDLIMDRETRDVGLLIEINHKRQDPFAYRDSVYPYRVVSIETGNSQWLEKNYIEQGCEVISMGS